MNAARIGTVKAIVGITTPTKIITGTQIRLRIEASVPSASENHSDHPETKWNFWAGESVRAPGSMCAQCLRMICIAPYAQRNRWVLKALKVSGQQTPTVAMIGVERLVPRFEQA